MLATIRTLFVAVVLSVCAIACATEEGAGTDPGKSEMSREHEALITEMVQELAALNAHLGVSQLAGLAVITESVSQGNNAGNLHVFGTAIVTGIGGASSASKRLAEELGALVDGKSLPKVFASASAALSHVEQRLGDFDVLAQVAGDALYNAWARKLEGTVGTRSLEDTLTKLRELGTAIDAQTLY